MDRRSGLVLCLPYLLDGRELSFEEIRAMSLHSYVDPKVRPDLSDLHKVSRTQMTKQEKKKPSFAPQSENVAPVRVEKPAPSFKLEPSFAPQHEIIAPCKTEKPANFKSDPCVPTTQGERPLSQKYEKPTLSFQLEPVEVAPPAPTEKRRKSILRQPRQQNSGKFISRKL